MSYLDNCRENFDNTQNLPPNMPSGISDKEFSFPVSKIPFFEFVIKKIICRILTRNKISVGNLF